MITPLPPPSGRSATAALNVIARDSRSDVAQRGPGVVVAPTCGSRPATARAMVECTATIVNRPERRPRRTSSLLVLERLEVALDPLRGPAVGTTGAGRSGGCRSGLRSRADGDGGRRRRRVVRHRLDGRRRSAVGAGSVVCCGVCEPVGAEPSVDEGSVVVVGWPVPVEAEPPAPVSLEGPVAVGVEPVRFKGVTVVPVESGRAGGARVAGAAGPCVAGRHRCRGRAVTRGRNGPLGSWRRWRRAGVTSVAAVRWSGARRAGVAVAC